MDQKLCWKFKATSSLVFLIRWICITLKRRATPILKNVTMSGRFFWSPQPHGPLELDIRGVRSEQGGTFYASDGCLSCPHRTERPPMRAPSVKWFECPEFGVGVSEISGALRKGGECMDQTIICSNGWPGKWPTLSAMWVGGARDRAKGPLALEMPAEQGEQCLGDFTVFQLVIPLVGHQMIRMFQKEKILGAGRSFQNHPGRVNHWYSAWGHAVRWQSGFKYVTH